MKTADLFDMKLYDNMPKEYRDLVKEYGKLGWVYRLYMDDCPPETIENHIKACMSEYRWDD